MATQVRVAGLVSFTTKVPSVMSTSGGSEQGGGREDCSQYHMRSERASVNSTCTVHVTSYLGMYVRMYILLLMELKLVPHVL